MRNRLVTIGVLFLLGAAAFVAAQGKNVQDRFSQAKSKEDKGDFKGAIEIYDRIVRDFKSPKDQETVARAQLQLGYSWAKSGEAGKVKGLDILNEVIKTYKDQPDVVAAANRMIDTFSPRPAPSGAPPQIATPFSNDPYAFAISPDGQWIVFLAALDGKGSLWLRHPESVKKDEPVPIRGTENLRYGRAPHGAFPFWSPDSRSIGFFADGKLKTIGIAGGTPKTLADAPEPNGGAWNSKGVILFSPKRNGPLHRVPADGSSSDVEATRIGSDMSHHFPQFLDDSRFLMYSRVVGLLVGSLESFERQALPVRGPARFVAPNFLVFATNGALFVRHLDPKTLDVSGQPVLLTDRVLALTSEPGLAALSVSATPGGPIAFRESGSAQRQLVFRDRKGEETRTLSLPDPDLQANSPRFSANGQRVSVFRGVKSFFYFVSTGDRNFHWDGSLTTVWSPDPANWNQVVYSKRDNRMSFIIWDKTNVTYRDKRLVSMLDDANIGTSRSSLAVEDWSPPKGDFLLYSRINPDTGSDLYVLPLNGPKQPVSGNGQTFELPGINGPAVEVAATSDQELNGRFSPNGDWIAYESYVPGGRPEIFVQKFPGALSERQRVSIDGGTIPQWSHDGRELYFMSPDYHLMVVKYAFSADEQSLGFGTPAPLFPDALPYGSSYAPDPDGQQFLINTPLEATPPVVVLSNWREKLPTIPAGPPVSRPTIPTPTLAIASNAPAAPPMRIAVLDRNGVIQKTMGNVGPGGGIAISRDGARVARIRSDGQLWAYRIDTNTGTLIASSVLGSPMWYPDGSRISYRATRNGVPGIYARASDGTGNEATLTSPANSSWNWSQDGRFLAMGTEATFSVLVVGDNARPTVPIFSTNGRSALRLSPNSRFIAYLSDETGRSEVWVRPFDPSAGADSTGKIEMWKVSTQGSVGMIRWKDDGKELYYMTPAGDVMAVAISTAPEFKPGAPKLLFHVPTGFSINTTSGARADVSADGERFLFLLPETVAAQQ